MTQTLHEPVRVWNRLATERDLAIGTFGASGSDGLWRVADFHSDDPLLIFLADYPDTRQIISVKSVEDWITLPEVGIEFVIYEGVCASSGHDEYLYHGEHPRFGLMLPEHEWRIIWHAAWGLIHTEAARRDRGD